MTLEAPKRSETSRNRKYGKFCNSPMIKNIFWAHLAKKYITLKKIVFWKIKFWFFQLKIQIFSFKNLNFLKRKFWFSIEKIKIFENFHFSKIFFFKVMYFFFKMSSEKKLIIGELQNCLNFRLRMVSERFGASKYDIYEYIC